MSSTTGSAGAMGASVDGVVDGRVSTTVVPAADSATGTGAVSARTTGAGVSTFAVVATAFALPVGSVIVPTGDGNWLTTELPAGAVVAAGIETDADEPSGARAACGALLVGDGVVGVGSVAEFARSAAPNAAVMPRIAVAERPVDKMRAERATWRSRWGRAPGRSVVVIVVLAFVVFVPAFPFAFVVFVLVVALVVIVVMRRARWGEIATRR